MKHGKTSRLLLPLLSALLMLSAGKAYSQAGGGSKGGVVLACFTSDPTKFMVDITKDSKTQSELALAMKNDFNYRQPPKIYSWPAVNEDPTDPKVGYASKAIVFDAVNRLKYVQVAEYYLATTDTSWGGSEDQFVNGAYRLHPLLYAINELPVSKKAVPEAKFLTFKANGVVFSFPKEKLSSPATLNADEEEQLFNYVEMEEQRIIRDRELNTPVFSQIYGLVSNMFRGVPAFYTRLQAAHDRLGPIPDHPGKLSGSKSDQWDSKKLTALTSLPNPPENCLWMTAADRVNDELLYDRYLWSRMDLFQRALLQLHEEIYYMGSDATNLGLFQRDVGPTRYLLSHFLRGERTKSDVSGDFASVCAFYDINVSKRTPPVRLLDSGFCQIGNGLERTSIKAPDTNFLPSSLVKEDGTAFVSKFLCSSPYGCPTELTKTWEKVARYYGPYSSTALANLLANEGSFFGRYSTIDRLTDKRDKASQIVSTMVAPYETLWGFCDKSGYATGSDLSGPSPARNNPRRLEEKDRKRLEKRQEDRNYVLKPDEPRVTVTDLNEIVNEEKVFRDIKRAGVNMELQVLSQRGMDLLNDYPDLALSAPVSDLLGLKIPASFFKVSDLEPNKGKAEADLMSVCQDVHKRRTELNKFLKLVGSQQDPHLTFYEGPDENRNALDLKVPR